MSMASNGGEDRAIPRGVVSLLAAAVLVICAAGALRGAPERRLVPGILPQAGSGGGDANAVKAPPLMHTEEEFVRYLSQASELVASKRYDQAIQIIQALIQREESGFYPEGRGRFVSMRRKASDLLGHMGEKGLKLYRALYGPQAEQLYKEALASDRAETLLRRVAERYAHTAWGPKALETLGAKHFDRAAFSRAASCWRRLVDLAPEHPRAGALRAMTAVALHLAGDEAEARRQASRLRERHAGESAVLGGRERKLVEFVAGMLKRPPVGDRRDGRKMDGWPGQGAVPDGLATMTDCDVVLAPRWRHGPADFIANDELLSKIQAGGGMLSSPVSSRFVRHRRTRRTARLRGGRVRLRQTISGRSQTEIVLPGVLHPLVVGDQVIARLDDAVVGMDLLTGEELWRTVEDLAMVRKIEHRANVRYYSYGGAPVVGDLGRHTLTLGGGRIYTVCSFRPSMGNVRIIARGPGASPTVSEGSKLAAVSLRREGSLLWILGRGNIHPKDAKRDGADVLRWGTYLAAPCYRDERLYAVCLYLQRYHLLCLDAEDGSLLWKAPIAQAPAIVQRYRQMGSDPRLAIGSPPAVADGRVYVTTNAGVVAAFDADTGQPAWGYEYRSELSPAGGTVRSLVARRKRKGTVLDPGNPLIVTGGRVICLPADSEKVLAFDADDGALLWAQDRRGQAHLNAIDSQRVLLSGEGLWVLRARNGKAASGWDDLDVHARPAVTESRVLASGNGEIKTLDLKSYELSSMGLTEPDGLLGNLVSADGKLVVGSMLGVCTYFSYEVAHEELTRRLGAASESQRGRLLRKRAQLAFDARRFERALEDLRSAEKVAADRGDAELTAGLSHMFYRTYVALGNHADSDEAMRGMFAKAEEHARTDQERAHMLLRKARYHERVGEYAKAAELAQEIADSYGDEQLVEVEIGPAAEDAVRFGPDHATVAGAKLARDYIRGLLEKYGPECYARFDARAGEALKAARAKGDPDAILAVAERWPNSKWVDDALFAAAEMLYRRGTAEKEHADLAEARRHLYRIARMGDSPLHVSASAALATIYSRGGWRIVAARECAALRRLDPQTPVAFADIQGTLGQVLRQIQGDKTAGTSGARRQIAAVFPPLEETFTIKGEHTYVLRDQAYRPVRLGEKVAILDGENVVMLNTASGKDEGVTADWRTEVPVDTKEVQRYAYYPPGMRLLGSLSAGGRVLTVADRKKAVGLHVGDGKVAWEADLRKLGIRSFCAMGAGSGVFVVADRGGKVVCLDMANGKVLWEGGLVGGNRAPVGPPHIAGGMVVFRHNGGKSVTCFSLGRNGRVVGKWAASQWTQCDLTADGLLIMLVDGELTVREPANLDKPLWTRKYEGPKSAAILAVSDELVAVSPGPDSGKIEVLSIPAGREVAGLEAERVSGATPVAFDAAFDARSLYVLCAPAVTGQRKANFGRMSNARGLHLQKFDVDGERHLWSRDFDTLSVYYPNVVPLVVGAKHVVVTARHHQVTMPHYLYIVEAASGEVAQRIDLRAGKAPGATESRRRQAVGSPVVTDGRLIVETSKGVTTYGKK